MIYKADKKGTKLVGTDNMRKLNARQLVKDMGGQAELHRKLNVGLSKEDARITLKGIEKWCERGAIPGHWLTEIINIAKRDKISIKLESYLPRGAWLIISATK